MKIKVLSSHIANVIAAGEVIERPASVIKELVENSIDAGAKVIKISVKDCGRALIEVDDNGEGMDRDDALQAFTRHATSKITTSRDLFNITTLGFRGEALPSIAAVARVHLETSNGTQGTILDIAGNKIDHVVSGPLRKGTLIRVCDLFYNTPARYKFMKSDYTENAAIVETVSDAALAHPEIIFELTLDGRISLKTTGTGSVPEVIAILNGHNTANNLLTVEKADHDFELKGYISKPPFSKATRSDIAIFINERRIRSAPILNKIVEAYGTHLPSGRFPLAVLFIRLDPHLVDVNVHPTKSQVKISKEKELLALIYTAISSKFRDNIVIPTFTAPIPVVKRQDPVPVVKETARQLVAEDLKEPDIVFPEIKVAPEVKKEEPMAALLSLPTRRIIGQLFGTYILIEEKEELQLIDQHAAMERINFEKYMALLSGNILTIGSLMPLIYEVRLVDFSKFEKNLAKFEELGFTFELCGPRSYRLVNQPVFIVDLDQKAAVDAIVEAVLSDQEPKVTDLLKEKIAGIACKASLKGNTVISLAEMERLIADLYRCMNPSTCPHGRPVIISYSKYEIEKAFRRTGF